MEAEAVYVQRRWLFWVKGMQLGVGLMGFFFALSLITYGLGILGPTLMTELDLITANPFIALFIGILVTAIVQSSSTTTTFLVSLVAVGLLEVEQAIPFIMGANIGTAATSTIVALGFLSNRDEFEQAVAASALHGLFNILTAFILFLIEITTHSFAALARFLTERLIPYSWQGFDLFSLFDPLRNGITERMASPFWIILLGLAFLYVSLYLFNRALRLVVKGQLKRNLNRYVFERPAMSLLTGIGTTVMVQSSSVTTSLIVPLVANQKIRLRGAFPFIMGANLGTTSTALLAGLLASGPIATTGLAVGLIHFLFNLLGVLIFFPFRRIRMIPIRIAYHLGSLSWQSRLYGVTYVMLVFFILPFLLIIVG